ncbi:ParA family protein [Haloferax sp. Atlit-4N]|uniref:ParA family protein n=1 Tax=Haloferax sp. Atlit-4N TaxID=2077206 RepID=UPI000E236511|nr:ParA family protein [Haloferax sp. Atlit-4N]RDZ50441.1 ParA family protein [Haloferax sp. Atlit-4N]
MPYENGLITAATYVEKGGVGKTTTAAHVAVAAQVDHGLDTLLIDLAGTQNDLATQFGLDDEIQDLDAPISAVFGSDWDFIRNNIPDVVDRMVFETDEGPDIIPADPGLGGADNNLANIDVEDRYEFLRSFIEEDLGDRYDFVLMDLPGKEDNISLNGLFAAENVVAPLKPGAFEENQLRKLEATLEEINVDLEVDLRLALVFATMVDGRVSLHDNFVEDLAAEHPELVGEPIPATAGIGNSQDAGHTLFGFDDDERLKSASKALAAYRENTTRLLNNITPK